MAELRHIISDASNMLEVEPHVLRYWEEELEIDIPRNELGHRYYRDQDIELLRQIKILKDQGLQLKAIKMILPNIMDNKGDQGIGYLTNEMKDNKARALDEKQENKEVEQDQRSELITNNKKEIEYDKAGKDKVQLFQEFIKKIMQETLQENNEELKNVLTKEVSGEIRDIFKENELLEEKKYKKLDETIREIQKARQEIASSTNKGLFKKIFNK